MQWRQQFSYFFLLGLALFSLAIFSIPFGSRALASDTTTWVQKYATMVDSTHANFTAGLDSAVPSVTPCGSFSATWTCVYQGSTSSADSYIQGYAFRLYKGTFPDNSTPIAGGTGVSTNTSWNNANLSAGSTDGAYWYGFVFGHNVNYNIVTRLQPSVYFVLYRTGGVWSTAVQNTSTRFTSFTIATTTGTVNIQGYWNATTTSGIYEQLQFYQYDDIFGQQAFITQTATTTGNFNWTFPYIDPPTTIGTTTAQFGVDTTFYAKIYQYNNAYYNDPFSGIINPLYKTLLVATSTTMTPSALFYNLASTTALFAYPEYECGLTSMIGCIKNALIWAFYPTEDTITNYNSFLALIQEKPPIGYFTVVKNNLNNLNATSTSAFSVVLPYSLKHYIFDPFDVGLASILWFFFIFNFYKRLKHITI